MYGFLRINNCQLEKEQKTTYKKDIVQSPMPAFQAILGCVHGKSAEYCLYLGILDNFLTHQAF